MISREQAKEIALMKLLAIVGRDFLLANKNNICSRERAEGPYEVGFALDPVSRTERENHKGPIEFGTGEEFEKYIIFGVNLETEEVKIIENKLM